MAAYTEMMFGTKDARGAGGWILDGHVTGTHNGAPGIRLFIRTSMSAYCRRCFFFPPILSSEETLHVSYILDDDRNGESCRVIMFLFASVARADVQSVHFKEMNFGFP